MIYFLFHFFSFICSLRINDACIYIHITIFFMAVWAFLISDSFSFRVSGSCSFYNFWQFGLLSLFLIGLTGTRLWRRKLWVWQQMLVPYFIFQAHYYEDSFFHFYEILNYLLPFTSSFPTFWYVLKASVAVSVMCPFRSLVFIHCPFISLSFCTFGLILSSRIWANSSFIWESVHWKIRSLFDQSHQSFINSLAEVNLSLLNSFGYFVIEVYSSIFPYVLTVINIWIFWLADNQSSCWFNALFKSSYVSFLVCSIWLFRPAVNQVSAYVFLRYFLVCYWVKPDCSDQQLISCRLKLFS